MPSPRTLSLVLTCAAGLSGCGGTTLVRRAASLDHGCAWPDVYVGETREGRTSVTACGQTYAYREIETAYGLEWRDVTEGEPAPASERVARVPATTGPARTLRAATDAADVRIRWLAIPATEPGVVGLTVTRAHPADPSQPFSLALVADGRRTELQVQETTTDDVSTAFARVPLAAVRALATAPHASLLIAGVELPLSRDDQATLAALLAAIAAEASPTHPAAP